MAKGGFKVLINGRVERVHSFTVDYDEATFTSNLSEPNTPEYFERKTFAVMTVTKDDMEEVN